MTDSEYEFLGDSKPKRRGWLNAIVWVMIVVLAGTFAVGAGSYFFITNQLSASGIEVYSTDGNTFDLPTPEDIEGPINVLLIGSDTREGQGDTNYGPVGSALADVIIMLHISSD
ncbi:MAG: hypothetical protein HN693_05720, partial [Micrococcales bacterium]|nr:hypothetical protein [Micrococcales bacterium]